MATLLFRLAPGAIVPPHEHTGVERTYVPEGSLGDEEGVCTTGNFVWRYAGNTHEAHAPNGALLLGVFMSPDHFAAGQKFFTGNSLGRVSDGDDCHPLGSRDCQKAGLDYAADFNQAPVRLITDTRHT